MLHNSRERPARCAARASSACAADISLNRGIEPLRVESLKPSTKPRQLARRKLFDGFLDVFGGGRSGDITLG